MRCANCGNQLIPGKPFCQACGAPAPGKCPRCGAAADARFRFCPDCGAPLLPAPTGTPSPATEPAGTPPSDPAVASTPAGTDRLARLSRHIPDDLARKIRSSQGALAGERKLVTVLFCDLVGSTAIAERLDPEEYRDLLEQYVEIALREIYRVEGIVNQLAGDGVMALFGAPLAHEDAPHRAVTAALAIRDALARLNVRLSAERDLELRVRVGIHTGPVVVGAVGNDLKMDYTAIGDTTNLASRLQALAEPGAILVSEATHRMVHGFFAVRQAGPFAVKGKSEPVVAYEVLGQSDKRTAIAVAEARGLTPLVGRGEELAQLAACYARLAGGLAQVVAIVGDAGSGKSRLLYEFRQMLAGEPADFFETRCSALGQMVPNAPWIAMLRQYFGLAPEDTTKCACAKIADKLGEMDEPADEIFPSLCRMLSLPVDEREDLPADEVKRATFEAVARVVYRASERAPVVMIIEDLHWIDEASREMLELAVGRPHRSRVMIVVTHRPDYMPSWRPRAAFTQLVLGPLSDDETTRIVRAVAGGALPAELERQILLKAEGNPFFAEEITRGLAEEGYLLRTDGQVRLTGPVAQIRMPGTVEDILGARIDRLGHNAKRVVQVASVFGRQFSREQLAQVLADEGIDVAAELSEIERRGVIHRKTALSEDEFRFGESLTQEVAYEGLLLKQRRELHERVGQAIEAAPGEMTPERSALLAHHFSRSDNRDKAIDALLRAALDAERLPSYRTAASFYRQAWELADAALPGDITDDTTVDAQTGRRALTAAHGLCRMAVFYAAADTGEVDRAAQRGSTLAETLGDQESLAHLYAMHGMLLGNHREKAADAQAYIEKGLAVARQAGLDLPAIAISRGLAWSYLFDGQLALATRTIAWTVEELERRGHRESLSDIYCGALYMRDVVTFYCDDMAGALAGSTQTHELALRASNRTIQSRAADMLAHIHLARAEHTEAKRWADRSLDLARALDFEWRFPGTAAVALTARIELGEPVAAARHVELIQRGLANADFLLSLQIGAIVDVLLAVGDLKRAERAALLAYEQAAGRLRQTLSAVALGEVLFRLGRERWERAQRCYEQAIAFAEAIGSRSTLVSALIGTAELGAARGQHDESASQLERAIAICRDLRLARPQARAERLLTELRAGAQRTA